MGVSSFIRVGQFKSPLRVVAAILLRSREAQVTRASDKSRQIQYLQRIEQQQQRVIAQMEKEIGQMSFQIAQLKVEIQRLNQQSPVLPHDPILPHHEFGPKMIAMCVNLGAKIGLRASVTCLEIVFDWLGADAKLPDWTTVRTWMMRVGVAAIEEPIEQAEDWVWMADHSNQIGQEKALVVIGLRASKMPLPGVALTHQDIRLLAVQPGVSWKREDMARVYEELAIKIGNPLAVVVDGAVELREGAEVLEKRREGVSILSDFKHFAANVLKKSWVKTSGLPNSYRKSAAHDRLSSRPKSGT